jgi:putative membrane protein
MKPRRLAFAVALCGALASLLATASRAQIGNPGFATPTQPPSSATREPPPNQTNATDRLFVLLVGAGGLAEVEAARLADARAASAGVKGFAQRMVQDHGRANGKLADLARAAGVTLPTEPDPDHQAMQRQLQGLQGQPFELAYLRGQLVDHQKTAQLLEWEIGQGQHAELQRYAMATLPAVMAHLAMVQGLLAEATGTMPSGLAEAPRHTH